MKMKAGRVKRGFDGGGDGIRPKPCRRRTTLLPSVSPTTRKARYIANTMLTDCSGLAFQ